MNRRQIVHLALIGISCLFLTSTVHATVTIEQQIPIINQEYSTIGSAQPTDNSLGLIYWDQDAYSNETVYFETVIKCDTCSGGNNQALAQLYTAAGSAVTNATTPSSDGTYTIVRSGNITSNLTDNTEYSVRLSLDATAGTAYLISAKLIVVQSATSITNTQSQIEIGSSGNRNNTAYMLPQNPKIIHYDSSNYAPNPSAVFEASLVSSAPSTNAYAALSTSSTCASTVTNSEVTVTGQTWQRSQSSSLTLSTGDYYVCIKADSGSTAYIANAKIILTQANSGGVSKTKLYYPTHTTPLTDSDSTYTSYGGTITYDPANFSGAFFDYFYESILQTDSGSAYAYSQLYDTGNTSAIANSELSTNATSPTRVISAEIGDELPSSSSTLDTQLKNQSTNTTTASGAWLISTMSIYPELTFTINGVAASTSTNGVTTSVTSQPTELDFGSLTTNEPQYIAHQLTVSTTAGLGYTVSTKLNSTLQGNYPANIIESFPATWESPQAWTQPTGTTANVNTGWIGANTSDTRVEGWESASALFGPLGTTNQTVMTSADADAGTSIYVTYVIEVNQYQPTDTYLSTLVYNVLPTY